MAWPASLTEKRAGKEIPMDEMDAIIKEFVAESKEGLDQLDRDLVELEKNPAATETLASIFRTIHSIKGATGFLGFSRLGAVAHAGESLLSRLRDKVLVINLPITSGLLALVDCIRHVLSSIEETGAESDTDHTVLIESLTRLQEIGRTEAEADKPIDKAVNDAKVRNQTTLLAEPVENRFDAPPEAKESRRVADSTSNIRVDVKQLDILMNLVGELVLTRNEMLEISSVQQDSVLLDAAQRLNFITAELQEGIMKTRMRPIDNVWNKFPRVVRDLALEEGKKVRLVMEGRETEIDKTLIEAIKDPLMHLVRNSIDHGLEAPDKRALAGKSPEGLLLLRAFHEGGQVKIEITDDGAGIDLPRVKQKAVALGLITADQVRFMDEQEAMNLIFLPGFSTAESITSISGRGVGMDVVKTNIEKIGGKVAIQSQPGLGTTFKIRIPLTLAIMPALVVAVGRDRYAIPQVSVLELVRLEGDEVRKGIERIQDAPVYRLRGDLLPLIWLEAELKVAGRTPDEQSAGVNEVANIVVLHADGRKFGLIVDGVHDTQDIVVKPLGRQLRRISVFAGATIMGNGRVALILDVLGLALHARVVSELRGGEAAKDDSLAQERVEETEALLLFEGPHDTRMALSLSCITRLQEFPVLSVERTGAQEVVQYRGEILPLVRISTLLPERRLRQRPSKLNPSRPARLTDETIQTVIYSKDGRNVGLVVDHILDTIEQNVTDRFPPSREGVIASAVIQGRITEILDPDVISIGLASASLAKPALVESKV
jgi:two-component system chemotaxis sensor kinase CheA